MSLPKRIKAWPDPCAACVCARNGGRCPCWSRRRSSFSDSHHFSCVRRIHPAVARAAQEDCGIYTAIGCAVFATPRLCNRRPPPSGHCGRKRRAAKTVRHSRRQVFQCLRTRSRCEPAIARLRDGARIDSCLRVTGTSRASPAVSSNHPPRSAWFECFASRRVARGGTCASWCGASLRVLQKVAGFARASKVSVAGSVAASVALPICARHKRLDSAANSVPSLFAPSRRFSTGL